MTQITFKGQPVHTCGNLPSVGSPAPNFLLTQTDLTEMSLTDLKDKRVILNIFPSIDTPVCATSVRRFNAEASKLDNCVVLCVSMDLPFAHARFCGAEGLDDVIPVSSFRAAAFGEQYGLTITDGPLKRLLARAVVIIDGSGQVIYTQLVPEISQEPDYEAALKALV